MLLKDGGEFFYVPGLVAQEMGGSLPDRVRHSVVALHQDHVGEPVVPPVVECILQELLEDLVLE